jgi:hypothetical protein
MQVITAPEPQDKANDFTIFLAGSIEQDKAERWQDRVIEALRDTDFCVLNPRRKAWDATWKQSKDEKNFVEQVKWELRGQRIAAVVLFYFDPNTKAPVTMLELGLFNRKAIVCCPEGYWRKGNVDIVCEEYGIPMANSLDELVSLVKSEASRREHSHSGTD